MVGNFLGDFSLSLGDFFTKTSGHPAIIIWPEMLCHKGEYGIKNQPFVIKATHFE
jgi:hypothetical protein